MGHESHWVSGQVEPRPSVATRLGAELPSSQGTCVIPRGHDCGHQAASATCMSSCVPRPPAVAWAKLSAPLPPVWPTTATWPAGLWPSAPTAQALQSPAQASEIPGDFPPSLGSLPHRLGPAQPGLCSRGNGGVSANPEASTQRTVRGLGAAASSEGNGPTLRWARVPHMRRRSTGDP